MTHACSLRPSLGDQVGHNGGTGVRIARSDTKFTSPDSQYFVEDKSLLCLGGAVLSFLVALASDLKLVKADSSSLRRLSFQLKALKVPVVLSWGHCLETDHPTAFSPEILIPFTAADRRKKRRIPKP